MADIGLYGMGGVVAKDDLQKGVEKIIKGHGGEKVKDKTYDMSKEVKKEGDKGKGKSK